MISAPTPATTHHHRFEAGRGIRSCDRLRAGSSQPPIPPPSPLAQPRLQRNGPRGGRFGSSRRRAFDVGAESSLARLSCRHYGCPHDYARRSSWRGGHSIPHVLKLDIEGAESEALNGAAVTLREARPVIFVATHGSRVHASCISILRRSGYTVRPIEHPSESSALG